MEVNKVRGYRKMLGLTQKDLALLIGISENQYRLKEKGKYEFSQSEMKKIHELICKNVGVVSLETIFF